MTNKKEEIKKLKEIVEELLGSICTVCKKKKKVMQNHHLEYYEDELNYKDFKNNDDYQLYILPIIIVRPQVFARVCRGDHWEVTRYTKTPEMREQFERFADLVRITK